MIVSFFLNPSSTAVAISMIGVAGIHFGQPSFEHRPARDRPRPANEGRGSSRRGSRDPLSGSPASPLARAFGDHRLLLAGSDRSARCTRRSDPRSPRDRARPAGGSRKRRWRRRTRSPRSSLGPRLQCGGRLILDLGSAGVARQQLLEPTRLLDRVEIVAVSCAHPTYPRGDAAPAEPRLRSSAETIDLRDLVRETSAQSGDTSPNHLDASIAEAGLGDPRWPRPDPMPGRPP